MYVSHTFSYQKPLMMKAELRKRAPTWSFHTRDWWHAEMSSLLASNTRRAAKFRPRQIATNQKLSYIVYAKSRNTEHYRVTSKGLVNFHVALQRNRVKRPACISIQVSSCSSHIVSEPNKNLPVSSNITHHTPTWTNQLSLILLSKHEANSNTQFCNNKNPHSCTLFTTNQHFNCLHTVQQNSTVHTVSSQPYLLSLHAQCQAHTQIYLLMSSQLLYCTDQDFWDMWTHLHF